MAITPMGKSCESNVSVDDIVVVDGDLDPVEGELMPSSESLLHVAIYAAREDVGGIVHTHAVYSSAVAAAGNGDTTDCGRDGGYAGGRGTGVEIRATGLGSRWPNGYARPSAIVMRLSFVTMELSRWGQTPKPRWRPPYSPSGPPRSSSCRPLSGIPLPCPTRWWHPRPRYSRCGGLPAARKCARLIIIDFTLSRTGT